MKNGYKLSGKKIALYILPGAILYTFIAIVPIFLAFYYGMFNWSGGKKKTYIGFENFVNVLKDDVFLNSLRNNLFLIVVCIIGQIGIAFILAMLLSLRYTKLKNFHRTISYMPAVLSSIVIGFIWNLIYDYNYGLLNSLLKLIGKEDSIQAWLNNPEIILWLVAIPLVWQYIGYYLIIIMSALTSIDPSILEMAEIDGANAFQRAVKISLPLIKSTLIVCVTLCIAGNLKIFDLIYSMTNGGPGNASSVMAMYAYKTSFLSYKMGYGSAMSIIIMLISLVLVGGSKWVLGIAARKVEV